MFKRYWQSFTPQGHHRLDAGGSTSGNVTSQEPNGTDKEGNPNKRYRIGRA
jgi:hypothetical protein